MPTLKQIIEETDTPEGQAFDLANQTLIVLSLISLTIGSLPSLSPIARSILTLFDLFALVCFTLEYALRVFISTPRRSYVLSFFGIIDLLAILPYFLAWGMDLRSVRSFRLLRMIRFLKLARYNAAVRRLRTAMLLAREEIVLFLGATAVMLYVASVGIHQFEREAQPETFGSVFQCLWWAMVTLTTVGYGDAVPITTGGRVFTLLVLLTGVGIVSVPAGLVASALTQARELNDRSSESPPGST